MTRRAAGLERLDDHHASAAARAGMRRLLCPCRAIVSLLLLRRLHRSRRRRCGDQLAGVRQRLGFDYFTDGTKTYSFPGNSDIDSNLNKPNAPIPSHGNLKWVSTSGMEAYDTPSGDLEVGDYAQEADGSYISNVPAYTYTDATSSVPIAAHIATSKTDPTAATQ